VKREPFSKEKTTPDKSGVAKVQGGGADKQRRRTDKGGDMSVQSSKWAL